MKTAKDKIDEVLGIADGQSIDDFLDNLELDRNDIQEKIQTIDNKVKDKIEDIDKQATQITNDSKDNNNILVLNNIETSLKEVEELIQTSKSIFKHIYESIMTTDLIDSELVGAVSKLLESIHINIAEFIELYKDRAKYVEKIKLMIFQQEQKKELMLLKHKLDLEKIQQKNDTAAEEVDNTVTYSVEEITKMLNEDDNNAFN